MRRGGSLGESEGKEADLPAKSNLLAAPPSKLSLTSGPGLNATTKLNAN